MASFPTSKSVTVHIIADRSLFSGSKEISTKIKLKREYAIEKKQFYNMGPCERMKKCLFAIFPLKITDDCRCLVISGAHKAAQE